MHAAFQQIAPGENVGIDMSREYEMALALHQQSEPAEPLSEFPS